MPRKVAVNTESDKKPTRKQPGRSLKPTAMEDPSPMLKNGAEDVEAAVKQLHSTTAEMKGSTDQESSKKTQSEVKTNGDITEKQVREVRGETSNLKQDDRPTKEQAETAHAVRNGKKPLNVVTEIPKVDEEVPQKTQRGRKPKNKQDNEPVTSESETGAAEKGSTSTQEGTAAMDQPRKEDSNAEEENKNEDKKVETSEVEVTAKRGRGRGQKADSTASIAVTASSENTGRVTRGRKVEVSKEPTVKSRGKITTHVVESKDGSDEGKKVPQAKGKAVGMRGKKKVEPEEEDMEVDSAKEQEPEMDVDEEATAASSSRSVKVKSTGRKRAATASTSKDTAEAKESEDNPKTSKVAGKKRGATAAAKEADAAKKAKVFEAKPLLDHQSGKVLSCGTGDFGSLGLGEDIQEKLRPAIVGTPEDAMAVCAGGMHTACIMKDGKVYTFGCNDEGALGRVASDDTVSEFVPGEVELPGAAVQISAGDSHTAALLADGRVFAWGSFRDSNGNMGFLSKPTVVQDKPVQVLAQTLVSKIASGNNHLVMLTVDGDILTCGNAEQGQLGRLAECFANRGGRKGISALLLPETVYLKKSRGSNKIKFDNIWAKSFSTFAKVKDDTDVYAWGLNNYSQLGLASGLEDLRPRFMPEKATQFSGKEWIKLAPGEHHTLALDTNGGVHVIGRSEYGRLGLGYQGHTHIDKLEPVPDLANEQCIDIAAGIDHSFAVSKAGKVLSWGAQSAQLGTGVDDQERDGEVQTEEEKHQWRPVVMASKHIDPLQAVEVSAGAQHTVILAVNKESQ